MISSSTTAVLTGSFYSVKARRRVFRDSALFYQISLQAFRKKIVKARLPLYEPPLPSSEEEEDDEFLSSDDLCSEALSDIGFTGERCYYHLLSDEEGAETAPLWGTNPELRWEVWQIDEFVLHEETGQYFAGVLWDWRLPPDSTRYRIMKPLDSMLETHCEQCWLAMRFKTSGEQHFRKFCKTDWYGQVILAVGKNYSCLFKAMQIAAKLLGPPNLVPQKVVDDFFAEGQSKFNEDLSRGCTWKQFKAFLVKLRKGRSTLKINEMIKTNVVQGGRRGSRVLRELAVEKGVVDGLYIVGAYNRNFVGHAVVLRVEDGGQSKTMIDKGNEMSVEECSWINFYSFVRPFRVW